MSDMQQVAAEQAKNYIEQVLANVENRIQECKDDISNANYEMTAIKSMLNEAQENITKAESEYGSIVNFGDVEAEMNSYSEECDKIQAAFEDAKELKNVLSSLNSKVTDYQRNSQLDISIDELKENINIDEYLTEIDAIESKYDYELKKLRASAEEILKKRDFIESDLEDRHAYTKKELIKDIDAYAEQIAGDARKFDDKYFASGKEGDRHHHYSWKKTEEARQKIADFHEKYPHIDISDVEQHFEELEEQDNEMVQKLADFKERKKEVKQIERHFETLFNLWDRFPRNVEGKFKPNSIEKALVALAELSEEDLQWSLTWITESNIKKQGDISNRIACNLANASYAKKYKKKIDKVLKNDEINIKQLERYFALLDRARELLFDESEIVSDILEYADEKLSASEGEREYRAEEKRRLEEIKQQEFEKREIAEPRGVHTDELEDKALASFNDEVKGAEYIRVIFISNEWSVARNDWGIVVGRLATAMVYAVYDAGECREFRWNLLQELNGEGEYGRFRVWSRESGSYFPREKVLAARKK